MIEDHLLAGSQKIRDFASRDAFANQPRGACVPQRVGGDATFDPGKFARPRQRRSSVGDRTPVECDDMALVGEPLPPAKVRQQPGRDSNGRLSFIGHSCPLQMPVENSALHVNP